MNCSETCGIRKKSKFQDKFYFIFLVLVLQESVGEENLLLDLVLMFSSLKNNHKKKVKIRLQ